MMEFNTFLYVGIIVVFVLAVIQAITGPKSHQYKGHLVAAIAATILMGIHISLSITDNLWHSLPAITWGITAWFNLVYSQLTWKSRV